MQERRAEGVKKTIVSLLLAAVLGLSAPGGGQMERQNLEDGTENFAENDTEDILEEDIFVDEEENLDSEDAPDAENETGSSEDSSLQEDLSHNEISDTMEEQEETEILEEFTGTFLTEDNAQFLSGETPEEEQMIEEIEEGRVIGFAPASLSAVGEEELEFAGYAEGKASAAPLKPGRYRLISTSVIANCDEVWTSSSAIHARVRYIEYVDSDGNIKRAPLYCLKASKMGIDNTGDAGIDLKPEAVRFFSNSTIKKILYFGYGGPGDICDDYDPSCSHVNWSKWQNRYVFTHQALSKVYANDVNGATQSQIEHVGLVRFINKIKGLTIPNRSAVKIRAMDKSGNMVTANPLNINMILYRSRPFSGFSWLEPEFEKGFQISPLCSVVDQGGTGNGMTVWRGTSDAWQLAYWTSEAEAKKNPERPVVLKKGNRVQLKNGYCFRVVYPKKVSGVKYFSWKMLLRPVKYILVDGSVQTGMDIQDFGACVYQGDRGLLKLNLVFQPMGTIAVKKTCSQTGHPVKGAVYSLYAAQDLYSGGILMNKKDTVVAEEMTNENGQIIFNDLIPGNYYIKEKTAAPGYLISSEAVPCTVSAGKTIPVYVTNDPDIQGSVSVEKVAEGTDIHLSDAEFTLFTWNKTSGRYENGRRLTYQVDQRRYMADGLIYSENNQGKYKIIETKNPAGYTGSWSQEFVLTENGTNRSFFYRVENTPVKEQRVEIRKLDSATGSFLQGAEFQIYEWDQTIYGYCSEGKILEYDADSRAYRSEKLQITDDNLGKYKIMETKNPEGYQGSWSQEIRLSDSNVQLQFYVKNDPIPGKYGSVYIRKKDSITGEVLSGAEFKAYAWSKVKGTYAEMAEPQDFIFHRDRNLYICSDLEITEDNEGRFLIKEMKAPDGYHGNWEKEIILERDGQILELEAVNKPEQLPFGQITVIKKIKEEEIIWAHGNPAFSFVITGSDSYGMQRRYEETIVYTPGGYTRDGNGNAVLSATVKGIPLGNYQIYEKQILRYYLEKAEANTSNVNIINAGRPQYGIRPQDIAYGEARLSMENRTASLTFYNRKKRYDGYSHNHFVENIVPIIKNSEVAAGTD